jgi:NitT/TauT family transport system permease protein
LDRDNKKRHLKKERSNPRAEGKVVDTTLKTRLTKVFHPKVMGIVCLFILWEIASLITPENLFPNPYVVGRAVILGVILKEGFLFHVGMTGLRIIIGFCISFSMGMSLGVLMGAKRFWEEFFTDYVIIGLTIPSLAWAVIGVLWLGLRPLTPVFATAMIVFPYVAINFWEGVKDVDKDLVDMGRAFDVSKRRIIKNIYIPSLLPFVFAAIRIGFSVSWKLVVLAEVFGSSEGIGYMIFYWYQMFDMELVLAWVLLFAFIMFFVEYGIIRRWERRLFSWRREVTL